MLQHIAAWPQPRTTATQQKETEETKESGETTALRCLCSLLFSLAAPDCSAATWAADRTVFEDVSSNLKTNGITTTLNRCYAEA